MSNQPPRPDDDAKADKAREVRLRRKAARMGLVLARSRRRDRDCPDYGRYFLYRDTKVGRVLQTSQYGTTLDNIEDHLTKRGQ